MEGNLDTCLKEGKSNMDHSSSNAKNINGRAKRQLQASNLRMVSLNLKVPMQFRQQLKIYAAKHDLTMTELLIQLISGLLQSADEIHPHSIKEISK